MTFRRRPALKPPNHRENACPTCLPTGLGCTTLSATARTPKRNSSGRPSTPCCTSWAGLVFIVGSVLFFPSLQRYTDIGAWTFLIGSLLYLVVTAHDYFEVLRNWRRRQAHTRYDVLERVAAASYLFGTLLFTVGSVLFLNSIDLTVPGAWCFVVGSLLFVVGSSINVLQILRSDNIVTMQLMNLTAVSFVVGLGPVHGRLDPLSVGFPGPGRPDPHVPVPGLAIFGRKLPVLSGRRVQLLAGLRPGPRDYEYIDESG